jgi:transcriptional regulator with XRE-family HTH domain
MEAVVERMQELMSREGLSASQLADRIGVQRSAISHILSGRNRPSLDLVMKLLEAFPEVSAEWMLRGQKRVEDPSIIESKTALENGPERPTAKTVEKVLVLYSDKTVEEYRSRYGSDSST